MKTSQIAILIIMVLITIGTWVKHKKISKNYDYLKKGPRRTVLTLAFILVNSIRFTIEDLFNKDYTSAMIFGIVIITWRLGYLYYKRSKKFEPV